MDWNKIKKENKLAYEKFINNYAFDVYNEFQKKYGYSNKRIFEIKENDIKTDVCFCGLVAFFDSVGIIITSGHDTIKKTYYHFVNHRTTNEYKTRPEAQDQAVIKAFELYEKELKNDKCL